jgi:hypothetical protein
VFDTNSYSETNSCLASQDAPSILWNAKDQDRVYRTPPPPSGSLSDLDEFSRYLPSYFLEVHFNIIYHLLGRPGGLIPSGFLTKSLYTFLFIPIHFTCPAHLIVLDLIILIIFGEEYSL